MSIKLGLVATAVAIALTGCSAPSPEDTVNALASQLDISYVVDTNNAAGEGVPCQALGADWASCNKITMTVKNDGKAIDGTDWKMYLHSIRVILDVESDDFTIKHITGDLYELTPTANFKGFAANQTIEIPLIAEYWSLFETDFMPGAYVTVGDAEPRAIESLNTENVSEFAEIAGNWKRTPDDNNILATAASRFEKNSDVGLLPDAAIRAAIIPTPLKTRELRGDLTIDKGFKIQNSVLDKAQLGAFSLRAERLGLNLDGTIPLTINKDARKFKGKEAVAGAYKLAINDKGVQILGYDSLGAFYGLQSMLALTRLGENTLPMVAIDDAPRFQYRGVMIDVARNFHSKDAVLRTIDQMAAYKLNKLHMHLTDDEGWRIEIPSLPELTEVGAKRCHDLTETNCLLPQLGSGPSTDNFGTGHFSEADFIEILRYAAARGIDVIPEIDMPAHSRAAVVSMEARYKKYAAQGDMEKANEYRLMDPNDTSNVTTVQFYDKHSFVNPCMDSSLRFVDTVITDVKAMYTKAGVTLDTWHFGGDEAKNIMLGNGYQDLNAAEPVTWKGNIDQSVEDKPFADSPACQQMIAAGKAKGFDELPSYFAEQVSDIVAKHGIPNFQAWQDGLKYSEDASVFGTKNVQVNFWDTLYWGGDASAYEWAKKGYEVIISNPDYVYMDMPYEVDPKERGYYWATRASDTRKMFTFAPENLPQNAETSVDRDGNGFKGQGKVDARGFIGLSAQLWSETVRTDQQFEYMVYPRVIAVAERAWHKGKWENDYVAGKAYSLETAHVDKAALLRDWQRFANLMGQRELKKIDVTDVEYRIPVPGATIKDNKLYMNISMPGLPMQYSLDNGTTWLDYRAPVVMQDGFVVKVRAQSANKQRNGREISL